MPQTEQKAVPDVIVLLQNLHLTVLSLSLSEGEVSITDFVGRFLSILFATNRAASKTAANGTTINRRENWSGVGAKGCR